MRSPETSAKESHILTIFLQPTVHVMHVDFSSLLYPTSFSTIITLKLQLENGSLRMLGSIQVSIWDLLPHG